MDKRRKITPYKLEYWFKRRIPADEKFLLIEDLPDNLDGREDLDWWKKRLTDMNVAFSVAIRSVDNEPYLSLFSEKEVFR